MSIDTVDKVEVVIVDTETGKTVTDTNWPKFWWKYGNGSCDCNRLLLFEPDSYEWEHDTCLGCHRYLIIKEDGYRPGPEWNKGYSEELIDKWINHGN